MARTQITQWCLPRLGPPNSQHNASPAGFYQNLNASMKSVEMSWETEICESAEYCSTMRAASSFPEVWFKADLPTGKFQLSEGHETCYGLFHFLLLFFLFVCCCYEFEHYNKHPQHQQSAQELAVSFSVHVLIISLPHCVLLGEEKLKIVLTRTNQLQSPRITAALLFLLLHLLFDCLRQFSRG